MPYPGPFILEATSLNYIERSHLSPIKLMSQITRQRSIANSHLGHYQLSGSIWQVHNHDFTQLHYQGTRGIYYSEGKLPPIKRDLVLKVYQTLKHINPLLRNYPIPPTPTTHAHITTDNPQLPHENTWHMKLALPLSSIPPAAADPDFNIHNSTFATDGFKNLSQDYPPLLALLFPHIYTTANGHYSLTSSWDTADDTPEHAGGVALMTKAGYTLHEYAKHTLLLADRRFGRDPAYIF
ncbi:hypothetical protein BCR43DRAFT_420812, partial [Syncephalastrum racemosum]